MVPVGYGCKRETIAIRGRNGGGERGDRGGMNRKDSQGGKEEKRGGEKELRLGQRLILDGREIGGEQLKMVWVFSCGVWFWVLGCERGKRKEMGIWFYVCLLI